MGKQKAKSEKPQNFSLFNFHLMLKMPLAGEHTRNAFLVGLADRIFVADRSAGLHDRRHAVFGGQRHAVVEGEETVRCQHQTLGDACGMRLFQGDLRRADAVHLPGADAQRPAVLHRHDGVRLHVFDDMPTEISQPYAQLTEQDPNIDRETILIKVIQRIYSRLAQFEEKGIDEEFMQQWINHNEFFGDEVNVFTEQGAISGREQGIDKRGYLKVITDEGERYFNAGEVSLRRK